ncbi:MAG: lipid-A-disaccharide synthase, partial [Prevotella sp.]|nr:lipid-A-disaccharide synthase [Prevotella sp.]
MKYYLIAGEASGDLHASHLITSLIKEDPEAAFRFFGGDNMQAAAGSRGTLVRHYRDRAYMGFIPVLLHLPTIMRGMSQCKKDILAWQPDCVIFVDYAGFNLNIAKYLRKQINCKPSTVNCKLFYYIAPKIWAWK